jgi:hypothetical protein
MTADHDDAEFADVDRYISRQLSEAAAVLTARTDTQARLREVFRAAGHDSKYNGEADDNPGG